MHVPGSPHRRLLGGSAATAILAALALASTAFAEHGTGVSFLVTDPLTFAKPKVTRANPQPPPPTSNVQVFNGSSTAETIRMHPDSNLAGAIQVEPPTLPVSPGGVGDFTITAIETGTPKSGVLYALSTDGTVAKLTVSITGPDTEPAAPAPDKLTFPRSKPFDPFGGSVGASQEVPGLTTSAVGLLANGNGDVTEVNALVFASGFSALYLGNETFGSTKDYVGVLVWGSTVQAGLAFLRRLPGGIKTLVGSS